MCTTNPSRTTPPATQKMSFNATGLQYRETFSFAYLRGTVTETQNLLAKIDQRIRSGWMSFRRYARNLYDRPKARLLRLKARLVKSKVGSRDFPRYGCTTETHLKGHYWYIKINYHVRHTTGSAFALNFQRLYKSPNNRIFSYKDVHRAGCESIETAVRRGRLLL